MFVISSTDKLFTDPSLEYGYIHHVLYKYYADFSFMRPKIYGSSQQPVCPFCHRQATQKNEQGLAVCHLHVKSVMQEIKCTCGSWLENRIGKFGPYFNCIKCGNINVKKAMAMKELTQTQTQTQTQKQTQTTHLSSEINREHVDRTVLVRKEIKERKEIIITSRDVEWFE